MINGKGPAAKKKENAINKAGEKEIERKDTKILPQTAGVFSLLVVTK